MKWRKGFEVDAFYSTWNVQCLQWNTYLASQMLMWEQCEVCVILDVHKQSSTSHTHTHPHSPPSHPHTYTHTPSHIHPLTQSWSGIQRHSLDTRAGHWPQRTQTQEVIGHPTTPQSHRHKHTCMPPTVCASVRNNGNPIALRYAEAEIHTRRASFQKERCRNQSTPGYTAHLGSLANKRQHEQITTLA